MKPKIKILIVDNHSLFRRGLASFVSSIRNFLLVGEAENGEVALKLIALMKPDVVVLDIEMPILDGIQTAKKINEYFPLVKVIFLTIYKDKAIQKLLPKLNVKGYVTKDDFVLEIAQCIEQVADNKIFISSAIQNN